MEISKSDIVRSLAGHDRGMLFYVIDTDGEYLLLANGSTRTLEHPKRKKNRHAERILWNDSRAAGKLRSGEKVLNSELRRELAAVAANLQDL